MPHPYHELEVKTEEQETTLNGISYLENQILIKQAENKQLLRTVDRLEQKLESIATLIKCSERMIDKHTVLRTGGITSFGSECLKNLIGASLATLGKTETELAE